MSTLIEILTVLVPVCYGLTTGAYAFYFVRRGKFGERLCTPLLIGSIGFHLALLVTRCVYLGRWPLVSLAEVLTLVALAIAVVYIYVERATGSRATGVFLVGMATAVQIVASLSLSLSSVVDGTLLKRTHLWPIHTSFAVLGYTGLAVGAVYGVMFVLLYRALMKKKFGAVFERLPALDVLVSMCMGATSLGFAFLTAAVVSGAVMSYRLVPSFYTDPKVIAAVIAWLFYGLTLVTYFVLGWRGARPVYLALVAFVIAVVTMVGSIVPHSSFHVFHA